MAARFSKWAPFPHDAKAYAYAGDALKKAWPALHAGDQEPYPDEKRAKALITVAGNPVVSTPDAGRLERALGGLDLLVCLDAYVTETSRHADVIVPAPSPLARSHYDVVFASLSVRNAARVSSSMTASQRSPRARLWSRNTTASSCRNSGYSL